MLRNEPSAAKFRLDTVGNELSEVKHLITVAILMNWWVIKLVPTHWLAQGSSVDSPGNHGRGRVRWEAIRSRPAQKRVDRRLRSCLVRAGRWGPPHGRGLSWKVRSARDRTIRTFQIGARSEFFHNNDKIQEFSLENSKISEIFNMILSKKYRRNSDQISSESEQKSMKRIQK